MKKPIYYYAPRGVATASGFYIDMEKKTLEKGFLKMPNGKTQPKATTQAEVKGANWPLVTPEQLEAKMKEIVIKSKGNVPRETLKEDKEPKQKKTQPRPQMEQNYQSPAIISAHETGVNSLTTVRVEKSAHTPTMKTLQVIMDNTQGTEAVRLVWGDGLGFIAKKEKVAPLPSTFFVTGTFGEETLGTLNNFAKFSPVVLKTLQLRTTDNQGSVFYSQEFIKLCKSEVNSVVTAEPMNLAISQDGNQFNENLRLMKDFVFQLNQLQGILFEIPAGEKLTVNTEFHSIAAASLQVLANRL